MPLNAGLRAWQAERRAFAEEGTRIAAEADAAWKAAAPARRRAATNERSAKRRMAEQMQTPAWASRHAIRAIYMEAQRVSLETGIPHHVDHEYPLQGKLVCGLHVENNLCILPGLDNRRKRNKFEVE